MTTLTKRHPCAILTVLLALSIACPLPAGIIFSNFGPGDTFDVLPGVIHVGQITFFPGVYSAWGLGFTPIEQDMSVTSIEVPVRLAAGANELDVFLMDSSGGLPGSVLEAQHLVGRLPFGSDPEAITNIASVNRPVLSAGELYWIVMTGGDATTWANWRTSPQDFTSLRVVSAGSVPGLDISALMPASESLGGGLRPAVRINGDPVPEPDTLLLLLSGLAPAMAFRAYRHHRS
jgi:hypothetical protein